MGFGGVCSGVFRVAHGMPPFHQTLAYEGPHVFSENEAVLLNSETGDAIVLTPMMFWHRDRPGSSWQNCMLYDGRSREGIEEYKLANGHDSLCIAGTEYSALESFIAGLSKGETRAVRRGDCGVSSIEERE